MGDYGYYRLIVRRIKGKIYNKISIFSHFSKNIYSQYTKSDLIHTSLTYLVNTIGEVYIHDIYCYS